MEMCMKGKVVNEVLHKQWLSAHLNIYVIILIILQVHFHFPSYIQPEDV
jgi:hypothetical protein